MKQKIDNENYNEELNDLFPIENYVSTKTNQKSLWNKTLKENSKVNKVLTKTNYDRLKEIKQKQIRRSKKNV